MNKKISVIIPVYNGEPYINRCVDSILAQQDTNLDTFEILLINDESKDASLDIINGYAKAYPGIVLAVDQKNIGAANTRNKAINLASGKYVSLLDQDDYIEEDYFKTLLHTIESGNYDIVQCGFKTVDNSNKVIKVVMPTNTEFGKLLAIPAWAKIYRLNFLKENKITFFDNNIGEDSIFTIKAILSTPKYKAVHYAGYNNSFDNVTSVTNTLHRGLSKSVNIIDLVEKLLSITSETTLTQKLLEYNIIRTCAYYLLSYGRNATPERFLEVYKELFLWLHDHLQNYSKNPFIWRKPKGEYFSASLGIKFLITLHRLHLIRLFAKLYCKGENL